MSSAIRADFPILRQKVHGKPLVYLDNGASAQKPRAVLDTIQRAYAEEYANVHRGLHYLSNLSTANFEKARETVRALHQCPLRRRDHLHPQRHRSHQSGGELLWRPAYRRGRRDRAFHHGAPFQHRALVFPEGAARRRPEMGADLRRRRAAARQVRGAAHPAHQDGRHHPYVERARHHRPHQGGGPHGAHPRHPRAGRRRARRGAPSGRCSGSRLRLLCLHRP